MNRCFIINTKRKSRSPLQNENTKMGKPKWYSHKVKNKFSVFLEENTQSC